VVQWLRRRVLWDVGSSDERAAMARAAIWLLAASGLLGLGATAAMTALSGRLPAEALVPSLGCTAIGAALLIGFERLSPTAADAALAGGTLLTATALGLGDDAGTGMEVYFLWSALFAAFFLGRRRTAYHVALGGAAYGAALAAAAPSGLPGLRWVLVMSGVALVGLLVRLLRERADALIARLDAASRTDPQTGLLNRRGFLERLEEELARARRAGGPVALVIADVDRLQALNDRHGHAAGDRVIAQVARTLAEHRRATDVVGRVGGDELAMILSETDEQAALIVAERLRRLAADALREQRLAATVSAGIAVPSPTAGSADAVLAAAGIAVAAANRLGGDRSIVHAPDVAAMLEEAERAPGAELHLATVLTLADALDLRDGATARHSVTVSHYATAMAEALGLDARRTERIRLAGLLHDIGKIAIPDAILRKPGPLEDDEWREMRRHPELGARMLNGPGLQDIRAWVLAHHERPDGRGYPRGLRGDAIPLEAAILAAADAYEAMTADRPYRRSIGEAAARAELRRHAGTQFDAHVVRAFLGWLAAPGERLAA
jgi:diguanylate cyclase (GGDEF)-like protein/putative nucleotidyltransferase with HDIG domain